MRGTTEDFRSLADLTENLSGEGLFWAPAIRILLAARPDMLTTRPASALLPYIDVGKNPGIRFEEMLRELDWSGPVREMVKVAWALFNGGDFGEPGASGEPPITAPTFDDVVCRLDLGNLVAVLEAMRLRKGFYGSPFPVPPETEEERELYRQQGFTDDMIDHMADDAARQISHDNVVREVRDRLVDQLRAVALALETQDQASSAHRGGDPGPSDQP